MNNKRRDIAVAAAAACLILILTVAFSLKPDGTYSDSERRKLASKPSLTLETAVNGRYAEEYETYMADQFPLRDAFRRLKACAGRYLFFLKDINGYYETEGQAAKVLYPLNEASLDHAAASFSSLYEDYLKDCGRIVFSIVPDKGYYLAGTYGCPMLDYEALEKRMAEKMPWAAYCKITDTLEASSYYRTDTHWRQECLGETAGRLAEALGVTLSDEGKTEEVKTDFYGVYSGQSALPLKPDSMSRYVNDAILEAEVRYAESGVTGQVYDEAALNGRDPYEYYLSGAEPLIMIRNPLAENDRRLILFRDSFASSLAPYLIEAYREIIMVDTRYMAPSLLGDYVDPSGCDVLFLYSTLILNDSFSLK